MFLPPEDEPFRVRWSSPVIPTVIERTSERLHVVAQGRTMAVCLGGRSVDRDARFGPATIQLQSWPPNDRSRIDSSYLFLRELAINGLIVVV